MKGPTPTYICNAKGNYCKELNAWYNGGFSVYGRCGKGVWKGIKSWPHHTGCETPKECPK